MGLFDNVWHLPLRWFGLKDIPAVPIKFSGLLDTILKLSQRAKDVAPARNGLSNLYTIGGQTATGEQFLYGGTAATQKLPALSLEDPKQFAMSWTNFEGVYARHAHLIPDYAATLSDAEHATDRFWPLMAAYGYAFNLLMLRKASGADLARLRTAFAPVWSVEWEERAKRGQLYFIDLGIFTSLTPGKLAGFTRFTPATVTLLEQNPTSKALRPFAVRVSGEDDAGVQQFVKGQATPSAWLYALQAAKASVTLYGIWLGHVYHWHIVSAAMQMTMYNTFGKRHPVFKLLAPQSNYLFQFDEFLLLVWNSIAPPTSITTRGGFLRLMNRFAEGRDYFDDDPTTALAAQGIVEADFTRDKPWDLYPAAQGMLQLWSATERYASAFVDNTYANDADVFEDRRLQAWMRRSAAPHGGNIRGLPTLDSRAALTRVLTSLIFRVTAHGISRLMPSAYPAQAFVANFPPCLQQAAIPSPLAELSTAQLLTYLPKAGTIASMMDFLTIFVFTGPYVPFIPKAGVEADLFFPDGLKDPRNQALVAFREAVIALMKEYAPEEATTEQWPLNIET